MSRKLRRAQFYAPRNTTARHGKGGSVVYTRNTYKKKKQSAPAPAPAPAFAPAPASYAAPNLTINNPYKAEADRLLKTIKEMEAAKPKVLFNNASPVSTSNQLQIAGASSVNKTSGTSNFKRRTKTKTTPTNLIRTIQSVNV